MITGPRLGPLDDDEVAAAYPWPSDRRYVRAMMVTSLDGAAAGPDGLSGSISSDADQAVFVAVRRFADAVLVGAGTLRDERYGPMLAQPADAEARRAQGSAPAPVLVIVSGSLDLPWEEPVFAESTVQPIVVTAGTPDPDRLRLAQQHSDVVQLPGETLEAGPLLDELERRGLLRIVCEGGPTLLESVIAAGLLDEADITVSPVFAGTRHTPRTPGLPTPARFDLVHVLAQDGFLMNRYVVRDPA